MKTKKTYRILRRDAGLLPYKDDILLRMENYERKKKELLKEGQSLKDFANGHAYFGFHKTERGWYYREWAPGADALYLVGDMNGWRATECPMTSLGGGVFEVFLPGQEALYHGCRVKVYVRRGEERFWRIPLYIRRVEQSPVDHSWCGVIEDEAPYVFRKKRFVPKKDLLIYECHIGMAQEKEGVGTYREFRENVLPRVKALGYNTLQIMALMEHPYYGSFGYQVSNFFAPSSRFGTANELKELIDAAHKEGIAVLLDVVHSHAIRNTAEGINEFDGTVHQFFHEGPKGDHPAWGTKLFNYGKNEVLHFLLSNLKYWLEEFHLDGFRFDGVTSMIYHNHGLGVAFTDYGKYFSLNTETEAITYLQLANELIKEVNPRAITVAEDMSGMPGMCLPIKEGGIGFDYRLAMGNPDLWVRLVEKQPDEAWSMWEIFGELTSRRPGEKYVAYVESHDQALVGDKTLLFRLCDSEMYTAMSKHTQSLTVDRGIALHKLIRFATSTLGGEGYLNFMGNEFGHPEWIDFPREGNGWSYFYCRRQWHLAEDPSLRYGELLAFDAGMLSLIKENSLFKTPAESLFIDEEKKVLVYRRGQGIFLINFHPTNSYGAYSVPLPEGGAYGVAFSSDDPAYGGFDRIAKDVVYEGEPQGGFSIYLPSRVALCLLPKIR